MSQPSVVFLGSKPVGYHCFRYLISQQEALGFRVAGVATRLRTEFAGESDLAALARQQDIPVLNSLEELPDCDIIYSVQHHELLQAAHLAKAKRYAVNLHLAPLPEYRGCNQFSFALIDGAEAFGATIHLMDPKIDHGDILFEQRFPVPKDCWVAELYEQTVAVAQQLFEQSLPAILSGKVTPVAQETLKATRPSFLHFRKEAAAIKEIDLSWDQEKMERHIRATSMPGFEPPYCRIGNQKVYFTKG